ncbi:sensor histidine kinase [Actinomadura rupiterrae]|uniref:sensor histidine kinase n=1 Tax=Actinomadura rupiterrae TaxID=559627 RepID=UPI0020A26BC3|nr:sensor histidine kinase [Actinomadura rupiterrae]MCP2335011.1 signal transduction histidine kinase [Actinomadura rupiterrae]
MGEVARTGWDRSVWDASWRPWVMLRTPVAWRAVAQAPLAFGFGLFWFVGLATAGLLSLALSALWIGLVMLVALMLAWRAGAMLERRVLLATFGLRIPDPYRPLPSGRNVFAKVRALLADPATWKDLIYLGLLLPIAMVEIIVWVLCWSVVGLLVLAPVLAMQGQGLQFVIGPVSVLVEDPVSGLWVTLVGLVLLVPALYVTRVMALAHALWAQLLLGASSAQEENAELRARAERLRASRARGVDAVEAERRRIERDLHDGAQQQLLAVAMDIGRARAKLDTDPDAARALIEQAHAGAKEAIAELRNLARGIYPAILTDRGLDAALSGLAARAAVPVEVGVELAERPPAAVESIAYFVVAEALTNVSKYANATSAAVKVAREGPWVVVEISDDGVGGAETEPGGGLAGLADRAATIDGILTVNSPPGGPTVIRADLPCDW